MKLKLKRISSILLSIALCLMMMASCNQKKDPDRSKDENSSSVSQDTSETTNNEDTDSSETGTEQTGNQTAGNTTGKTNKSAGSTTSSVGSKLDLKGRTITIALFGGEEIFTKKDGIYFEALKAAEKDYNCKIKIVTYPILELITKVEQAAVAGTVPFEAAMVEGYHAVPKNALSGQYLCLSDYVSFDDTPWKDPVVKDIGVFKGKRYTIPLTPAAPTGIYYNKKLVKAANLPDPWTYVDKGTWNWATFKSFAKALTKDTNNDGKPEQFGFISENPFYEFIITNGGQIIDISSGSGVLKIGEPNAVEAINFVLELYEEKIIPDPELMARSGIESAFLGMTTGKVAMFPYHIGYGPYLTDQTKFKVSDVGWVYFPQGNKKKEYTSPIASPASQIMVLRHVKQPKEVITVLKSALTFWDTSKSFGISFNDYSKKVAEEDLYLDFLTGNHLKMYQNLVGKTQCYNTLSYSDANNMLLTMLFEIREKKYTVSSGIDAYKNMVQQAIKDAETAG